MQADRGNLKIEAHLKSMWCAFTEKMKDWISSCQWLNMKLHSWRRWVTEYEAVSDWKLGYIHGEDKVLKTKVSDLVKRLGVVKAEHQENAICCSGKRNSWECLNLWQVSNYKYCSSGSLKMSKYCSSESMKRQIAHCAFIFSSSLWEWESTLLWQGGTENIFRSFDYFSSVKAIKQSTQMLDCSVLCQD